MANMIVDFNTLGTKQFEFRDAEEAANKVVKHIVQQPRDSKGRFAKKKELKVGFIYSQNRTAFDVNQGVSRMCSACQYGKSSINFMTQQHFCAGGFLANPYFPSAEEGAELLRLIEEKASKPGRKYGVLFAFIDNIEKHVKAFELAGFKREEFISPRYQYANKKGNPMVMFYKVINQ